MVTTHFENSIVYEQRKGLVIFSRLSLVVLLECVEMVFPERSILWSRCNKCSNSYGKSQGCDRSRRNDRAITANHENARGQTTGIWERLLSRTEPEKRRRRAYSDLYGSSKATKPMMLYRVLYFLFPTPSYPIPPKNHPSPSSGL